jgi:predicted alpha/beta hydrolase
MPINFAFAISALTAAEAPFLGHSLGASSFCVSNQAFKRNLRVRHSRSG